MICGAILEGMGEDVASEWFIVVRRVSFSTSSSKTRLWAANSRGEGTWAEAETYRSAEWRYRATRSFVN